MTRSDGEVSVTLLLNGGHSRTLYLRRKDPLLTSLVSSIGEKSYGGGRPARPFNIHLDEGRRSFIFSSTDLVGLVTDPPLEGDAEAHPSAMTMPRQPAGEPQPAAEKSPYVLIENFVDDGLCADLLKFALASEPDFTDAGGGPLALRDFPRFSGLFCDRVRSLVPQLSTAFGIGDFPVGEVDCTLTAQNHGDRIAWRSEGSSAEPGAPAIGYAFYFHAEPRAFTGGAFRLYNGREGGAPWRGAPAAEIEPGNNSILFFPSLCPYEVLALSCPSRRFADSRFAIIGSVRRALRP